jgi:hypothetical protein
MNWLESVEALEELEDADLDATLIAHFEQAAANRPVAPVRFSTPTFRDYTSTELSGCGKNSFPAFSITAGACALMCDHCEAKILEPMIPATNPDMLEQNLMFGSPDEVIAKLKRYEALGVDDFIYYASMGLGHKEQKHSLELFCSDVMPAFA